MLYYVVSGGVKTGVILASFNNVDDAIKAAETVENWAPMYSVKNVRVIDDNNKQYFFNKGK
jgi:hypothetical protein